MSRRHGLNLIELQIVVVIVAILAVVAIPFLNKYVGREKREGKDALLALIDGKAPAKPLAPDTQVIQKAGSVDIRQSVPPFTVPLPVEFAVGETRTEISRDGTSLAIRSAPTWWARWLLAPFVGFLLGGLVASAGFAIGPRYFRRDPEPVAAKIAVVLVCWIGMTWLLIPGEKRVVISGSPREVRVGSEAFRDAAAIAAVKSGELFALVAVVGTGTDRRAVELVTVPKEHAGLGAVLQEALNGGR